MHKFVIPIVFSVTIAACGGSGSSAQIPTPTPALTPVPAVSAPEPTPTPTVLGDPLFNFEKTRYDWGDEPNQFGDLYMPDGTGPWPVAIMIHGGCWSSAWGLDLQAWISEGLAQRGIAVWNIEYRSMGNGGEWPNMFLDVAHAADYLTEIDDERLNLNNVVSMGHSAGGHLALWLASRNNIPIESVLYEPPEVEIKGVVSMAGIPNLARRACGNELSIIAATELTGSDLNARLNESSPIAMLPTTANILLVVAELDGLSTLELNQEYLQAARSNSGFVELILLPGADHFAFIYDNFTEEYPVHDWVFGVIYGYSNF